MCTSCLVSAGGGSAASTTVPPRSNGNARKGAQEDDGADDDIAPASDTFGVFKPPTLICPMCAYPTTTTSVDRLPVNYAAVEALRRLEGRGSCSNCDEEEATRFCPECASCMCEGCCDRIHAHRIFQAHRPIVFRAPPQRDAFDAVDISKHNIRATSPTAPVALKTDESSFIPVPCYRHVHESLTRKTASTTKSVCPRCIEEEHSGHPIGTFRVITDATLQADLPEYLDTLDGIVLRCDTATAAVDDAIEDLGAQKIECLDRLQKNVQLLKSLMSRRAAELEGIVKAEHQRKLLLLHQQRRTLATRKDAATLARWVISTLDPAAVSEGEHVNEAANIVTEQPADTITTTSSRGRVPTDLLMFPPCNQTPSVVADSTVLLEKVTAYATSQRIDVTPIVETKLRLSFNGQVEPVERLLQSFGTFFSKKSRERQFALPVAPEADSAAATSTQQQQRPGSGFGRLTPAGLGDSGHSRPAITPRTAAAAPPAPYFSPLDVTESDTTGILYFFGCDSGVKSYQNPFVRETIEVRASSVGYGKIEHLVQYAASQKKKKGTNQQGQSRTSTTTSPLRGSTASTPSGGAKEFCTNNSPYSWVMIKLPAAVELHGYSLFHDAFDTASHFLRSWELRGLVSCSTGENEGAPLFSEDAFRQRFHYTGPLFVEISDGKWARVADPESVRMLDHLKRGYEEATIGIEPQQPKWWIVLDSRRNCDALRTGCSSACFATNCNHYLHQKHSHELDPRTPPSTHLETPRSSGAAAGISVGAPPCTQFMLIQTNVNSSSNHHLMVSCIELYGALLAS
ncbi:zinc finger protein, putative [Bodo saltans]|uniref:Zinc finger protein, putative n=1 Tax=Bodo saltans TaxID=75058 RepID=A0A0S4IKL3_BODSA|nr:zinc finger protein, putative [Bodo saltans]|eukprot:CUE67071.1 zinc finger protein, putative [Bodo saltans]